MKVVLIRHRKLSARFLFYRFSNDKPSWTYKPDGMHAVAAIDVGDRPIPEEPMYIIANLAISTGESKNLVDLGRAGGRQVRWVSQVADTAFKLRSLHHHRLRWT